MLLTPQCVLRVLICISCLGTGQWATGAEPQNTDELTKLREQTRQLRVQLSMASLRQMQVISSAAWKYADEHADTFPGKPSDLKSYLPVEGWLLFIAPWAKDVVIDDTSHPWDALDRQTSYVFDVAKREKDGGKTAYSVVLRESQDWFDDTRWYVFHDMHAARMGQNALAEWIEKKPKN